MEREHMAAQALFGPGKAEEAVDDSRWAGPNLPTALGVYKHMHFRVESLVRQHGRVLSPCCSCLRVHAVVSSVMPCSEQPGTS
jgi:hypothetical protein